MVWVACGGGPGGGPGGGAPAVWVDGGVSAGGAAAVSLAAGGGAGAGGAAGATPVGWSVSACSLYCALARSADRPSTSALRSAGVVTGGGWLGTEARLG